MSSKKAFLDTIYHLRTEEHIILYDKLIAIPSQDEADAVLFLATEYERESLDYPFTAPEFNPTAAIWGARLVYFSAQLLLYRDHKTEELKNILPEYKGDFNAAAVLSADICLRFLPQILEELKNIDADDPVVSILENYLHQFHYSKIGYNVAADKMNKEIVFSDACFKQLYLNRIVNRKDSLLAEIPEFKKELKTGFGNYQKVFWKGL